MTRIDVQIRLVSPLIIGGGHSFGTFNESLSYLPGGALRGAVGELVARENGHARHGDTSPQKDCAFCAIYNIGQEPIFENCYPSDIGGATQPLPLTAHTCKRNPGFPTNEPGRREAHGVFDSLIREYWFELAMRSGWRVPFVREMHCPHCRAEMKPYDGFYGPGDAKYHRTQPSRRRISRTAINRQRAVSADGLLYTLEVIDANVAQAPLFLNGTVRVDAAKADTVRQALERITRLGMGKSRGLGHVQVRATSRGESDTTTVPQRVQDFNTALRAEAAFYAAVAGAPALPDDEWFFTVELLSDALLTERGVPTLRLCPEMLELPVEHITLERWWTKPKTVGGWFSAARMPRRTELAAMMGSVFLYRVRGTPPDTLTGSLADLEERGIGHARERGFGQAMVCSPFHLEVL